MKEKTLFASRRKFLETASLLACGAVTGLVPLSSFATDPCDRPPAGQLIKAAKAMISGPTKKKLCISDHEFHNIKRATIVRGPNGKTTSMTGKMSHALNLRPDDQIYYTVKFKDDGSVDPNRTEFETDTGGLRAVLDIVFTVATLEKIKVAGAEIDLNQVTKVAEKVSLLVEGRGWKHQALAMLEFAAAYAALPRNQLPAELR